MSAPCPAARMGRAAGHSQDDRRESVSIADPDTVKQLVAAGAHLVRCDAAKVPLDGGWLEHPWTGEGACMSVGHVPGRAGFLCVDIDLTERNPKACELQRMQRVTEVVALLGPAVFTVDTPSGGIHLYYRICGDRPIPNLKLTVGDVRCDNGYAMLWGDAPQRLLDALRDIAITEDQQARPREALLALLGRIRRAPAPTPQGAGSGGTRGRTEGDRNQGLFDKVVAATANDPDPAPAVERAVEVALDAGLPAGEVDATVRSAYRIGSTHRVTPDGDAPAVDDAVGVIVRGWEAEEGRARMSQKARLASQALTLLDAHFRGGDVDVVRRMGEVKRLYDTGGAGAVARFYDMRGADLLQWGIQWREDVSPVWIVPGWLPASRLSFLFADGGIGKTRLAVQLAVARALGHPTWVPGDWQCPGIALDDTPRRVLFVSWEDTERAVQRGIQQAARALGIEEDGLAQRLKGHLDFCYAGDAGALWAPVGHAHVSTVSELTSSGRLLVSSLAGYDLAILDPLAAIYASDENQRGLVRAFVNTFDRAAQEAQCALLILAHSSKSSAVSGSTDWANAVRCVLRLLRAERRLKNKEPEFLGVRLEVIKMNEARKPAGVWLAEGNGGCGWRAVPQEESAKRN